MVLIAPFDTAYSKVDEASYTGLYITAEIYTLLVPNGIAHHEMCAQMACG